MDGFERAKILYFGKTIAFVLLFTLLSMVCKGSKFYIFGNVNVSQTTFIRKEFDVYGYKAGCVDNN